MFNPGGFLSNPWWLLVLVFPAIPVCIAIIKKIANDPPVPIVVLYCVVSLLSNLFLFITRDVQNLTWIIQNINQLTDFVFTVILLLSCMRDRYLRFAALVALLVYCGVFIALGLSLGYEKPVPIILNAGFAVIFILAFFNLLSMFRNILNRITEGVPFWVTAGLFFQYGLFSLLFIIVVNSYSHTASPDKDFITLYLVIIPIKYGLFSIGLITHKKLVPK